MAEKFSANLFLIKARPNSAYLVKGREGSAKPVQTRTLSRGYKEKSSYTIFMWKIQIPPFILNCYIKFYIPIILNLKIK